MGVLCVRKPSDCHFFYFSVYSEGSSPADEGWERGGSPYFQMFPRSQKKTVLQFRSWEVPVLMRSPKVQEGNTYGCVAPCLCVFLLFFFKFAVVGFFLGFFLCSFLGFLKGFFCFFWVGRGEGWWV